MLSCKEVTQRAGDWTDRTLPWQARLSVRMHLLICAMCRRFVRQYKLAADTAAQRACQHHPDEISRVLASVSAQNAQAKKQP